MHIHDGISDRKELRSRERLGEEVSYVLVRCNKGHSYLHVLDAFSYKEVTTLDMLDATMMLWVICNIASRRVVHT